jgi:hypothetical protein
MVVEVYEVEVGTEADPYFVGTALSEKMEEIR